MFKPLTLTLTSDETTEVYNALRKGLWAIKKIGNAEEVAAVDRAFEMFGNHERIGGFVSQADRETAYLQSALAELAQYGCD